ncbi:hypothetical protein CPC08DRAFT_346175 [Agrocybe pediades]|nr:hypothetical protein CPC08DRAFT_346175 [Agrocybe pediades]
MPVPVSNPFAVQSYQVAIYSRAHDIPQFVLDSLRYHPVKSNTILPLIEKRMNQPPSNNEGDVWIVVHTGLDVKFIASVTCGAMGNYPLFIFTPIPYSYLCPSAIRSPVYLLAQTLLRSVHRSRIYSVFAPQVVAEVFAEAWSSLTNIGVVQEPYYHSMISYVTNETLTLRNISSIQGAHCELRPATPSDINAVAELCFLFASDGAPFFLDREGALYEARTLIQSGQCWVYTVTRPSEPTKIACLVAYTRNTNVAATITKVVTHHQFRAQGCAEKLVGRVCRHLLTAKRYVSLFVGITNRAANVYRKVGFIGVGEGAQLVQDIDPYIELGFDRNYVQLGHW